jgi:uncharacterized protein YuzE
MERVNLKIGSVVFDHADYDAEFDILYLCVGKPEPSEAEDTPEGHAIHYAMGTNRIAALTIFSPRHILEREGHLKITFPEVVETCSAEDMTDALAAVA